MDKTIVEGKREVIFDMPDTYGKYRMVCRFGCSYIIDYAWWGHLQKEVMRKKFPWSNPTPKWIEIDQCWWCRKINNIEELKSAASKFYRETVELIPELKKKALSI